MLPDAVFKNLAGASMYQNCLALRRDLGSPVIFRISVPVTASGNQDSPYFPIGLQFLNLPNDSSLCGVWLQFWAGVRVFV